MINNPHWVDGASMSYMEHGPLLVIVTKVKGGWAAHYEVIATGSKAIRSDPREREEAKRLILEDVDDWYEAQARRKTQH